MQSIKEVSLRWAKTNIKNVGWLMTVCFIGMTFLPRSLDDVLFMDGLAYAAISRNMAIGQGSFWEPHFADSFWLPFNHCAFFCEHPPWMFGLESMLFRALGDTTAVENIYNTIVLLATIWLIVAIWQLLFAHDDRKRDQAWLPTLLWFGLRIVWWSAPNNLLDATMTVFCLCSCCFQLRALISDSFRPDYWILSGIIIVFACMTKGPVGIYPFAMPAIYSLFYSRRLTGMAWKGMLTNAATFISLMLLILQYAPARYFLDHYFQGQVMAALLQQREKVSDDWTAHFHLLRLLVINIVPHVIMVAALLVANYCFKLPTRLSAQTKKICLFTGLVAASVILPMLVSVKQGDHYLLPALPFVGLFFGAVTIGRILPLASAFPRMTVALFTFLAIASVMAMTYKLVHPDIDHLFSQSKRLSHYVPTDSKIYLPSRIAGYPEIHTAFQRYSRLSIAYDPNSTRYLFFDNAGDTMLDSIKHTGNYRTVDLGYNGTLAIHNE